MQEKPIPNRQVRNTGPSIASDMKNHRAIIATFLTLLLASVVGFKFFPLELLKAWGRLVGTLGYSDKALQIHNRSERMATEIRIRKHFDDEAVWVELPRSYYGFAIQRLLDMVPDAFPVATVGSPGNNFKICIPEKLSPLFTKEALDDYQKAQPELNP